MQKKTYHIFYLLTLLFHYPDSPLQKRVQHLGERLKTLKCKYLFKDV